MTNFEKIKVIDKIIARMDEKNFSLICPIFSKIIGEYVDMGVIFPKLHALLFEMNGYKDFGDLPIWDRKNKKSRLLFLYRLKDSLMKKEEKLWAVHGTSSSAEMISILFEGYEHAVTLDADSKASISPYWDFHNAFSAYGLTAQNKVYAFDTNEVKELDVEIISIEEAFKRLDKEMPKLWAVKGENNKNMLKILFDGYKHSYMTDPNSKTNWKFDGANLFYGLSEINSVVCYRKSEIEKLNIEIVSIKKGFERLDTKMPKSMLWAVESDNTELLKVLFEGCDHAYSRDRNTKSPFAWKFEDAYCSYGLSETGLVYLFQPSEKEELKVEMVSLEEAFKRLGKEMPKPRLWAVPGGARETLKKLFDGYGCAELTSRFNFTRSRYTFEGDHSFYGMSEANLVYCFTKEEVKKLDVEIISIEAAFKRLDKEMPKSKLWIVECKDNSHRHLFENLFEGYTHSRNYETRNESDKLPWDFVVDEYYVLSESGLIHRFNNRNRRELNLETISLEEAFKRLGKEMPLDTPNWILGMDDKGLDLRIKESSFYCFYDETLMINLVCINDPKTASTHLEKTNFNSLNIGDWFMLENDKDHIYCKRSVDDVSVINKLGIIQLFAKISQYEVLKIVKS
jgi:hypothetical protein